MGDNAAEMESLQLWHGRAVAACADFAPAYSRLQNALQPHWHGSFAHQLAIAFACADTKRYDTGVPKIFESMIAGLARDQEDRARIYRHPLVADRLLNFAEGSWRAASPQTQESFRGRLAVYGWITGRYGVAAAALEGLSEKLPALAREYLEEFEVSPAAFTGESVMRAGPHRVLYEAALAARRGGHFNDARLLFGTLLILSPPAAIPHLGESLKLVDAEQKLANGNWVLIAGEGRPWGWVKSEGDCTVSSRGVLHLHGSRERLRMYFTGRPATDFALKGTVQFNPKNVPRAKPSAFGILFDRNTLGAGRGVRKAFTMEIKPTGQNAGKAVLCFASKELSAPVQVELRSENAFEFTREGRKVVLRWNGTDVSAMMPADHVSPRDAIIGVGWGSQGLGAVTEVTRLEIRNLKVEL